MKKKSGAEVRWIVFSVIAVVVPVVVAVMISCLINSKPLDLNEILNSSILVVFSIACSLLSISWEVKKQKEDKFVNCIWGFSIVLVFVSWTLYVIFLISEISNYTKVILLVSFAVIILCSCLGIRLGKKSDENENGIIYSMHQNCAKIRKKLFSQECNRELKEYTLRSDDLLCNPDEFDRVSEAIKKITLKGEKNGQ